MAIRGLRTLLQEVQEEVHADSVGLAGMAATGDGAGDRNRTCDLRVTSALLYRLSYTGVFGC